MTPVFLFMPINSCCRGPLELCFLLILYRHSNLEGLRAKDDGVTSDTLGHEISNGRMKIYPCAISDTQIVHFALVGVVDMEAFMSDLAVLANCR